MANVYTANIQRVRGRSWEWLHRGRARLHLDWAGGGRGGPGGTMFHVPWARRRPWKLLLPLLHKSAELLAGRKTCQ